jgi:hypothetical protein
MCLISRAAHRPAIIVLPVLLLCLVLGAPSAAEARTATRPAAAKKPLSPRELFAMASPAVVKIHTYTAGGRLLGQGSGFFVSADGMLITNYHVVRKAASAKVVFPSGKKLDVTGMLASIPKADLALLKVDTQDRRFLKIAPRRPDVGTKVWAIGSPKGLSNTLSEGLVSGYRDVSGSLTLLQTTTPISQGSSGGPLLTDAGEVVGVATLTRIGGQNLNFAIPCKYLRAIVRRAKKTAKPTSQPTRDNGSTTRPASKKFASFSEILRKVPNSILPPADPENPLKAGGPHKWTKKRIHAFNAWAKTHLKGARLCLAITPKTRLESQPSAGGLLMHLYHWKNSDVGAGYAYTFPVALNEKSLMNLSALSNGKSVVMVGQIRRFHVSLTKANPAGVIDFSDNHLSIAVEFDNWRIDLKKPKTRPKRNITSKPKTKKETP